MIRRLLAAAAALAILLSASAQMDAWSNLWMMAYQRAQATSRTNTGFDVPPVDAIQRFTLDLGVVVTTRMFTGAVEWPGPDGLGPVTIQTNVVGTRTNLTIWTNHVALSSETLRGWSFDFTQPWGPVYSTNFLFRLPDAIHAEFPAVATQQPHRAIGADLLDQLDTAITSLVPYYVDTVAVSNAGGIDAWFARRSVTNAYWIDTDTNGTANRWIVFTNHPTALPMWTLSNLWKTAGLEARLDAIAIETTTNSVQGWTVGVYTSEYVDAVQTVTNYTWSYPFRQCATVTPYRVQLGQLRGVMVSNETTTGVVFSAFSQLAGNTLWQTMPMRHLTSAVCTVRWSTSLAAQDEPSATLYVTGYVPVVSASGFNRRALTNEAVSVGGGTNHTLAQPFTDIVGMSCAVTLTNALAAGSAWFVVWSNRIATLGPSTVARGTNAIAERSNVLARLQWTTRPLTFQSFHVDGYGTGTNGQYNFPTYAAASGYGSPPVLTTGIWPNAAWSASNAVRQTEGAQWYADGVDGKGQRFLASATYDLAASWEYGFNAIYNWPIRLSLVSSNLPQLSANCDVIGTFGISNEVALGAVDFDRIAPAAFPFTQTMAHATIETETGSYAIVTNTIVWTNDLTGLPLAKMPSILLQTSKLETATAIMVTNWQPIANPPSDAWLTEETWTTEFYVGTSLQEVRHSRAAWVVPTHRELLYPALLLRWQFTR